MNIERTAEGGLTWRISEADKRTLERTFEGYPAIPASYHRVSKRQEAPAAGDGQVLLEEALAEQKRESRQALDRLWKQRLRAVTLGDGGGYVWTLNPTEVECVLQILNDIRVGNWIQLGSPGLGAEWKPKLSLDTARQLRTMEVCGGVQMLVLKALAGR